MRTWIIAIVATTILACVAFSQNEDQPQWQPPKPTKQHEWLKQLVGEWTTEVNVIENPNQDPEITKGSESVRAIGEHWIVAENNGQMGGEPFTGILTLGYDRNNKKYIGTWIDSVGDHLWNYQGAVNEAGDTLTLIADGPNPQVPGATMHFRDSMHIKDSDHRVFTSELKADDGSWNTLLTINYTRKK